MHLQDGIFIVLSVGRIGGWAFVLLYPSGMHFPRSTAYLRPGCGWNPRNPRSESLKLPDNGQQAMKLLIL